MIFPPAKQFRRKIIREINLFVHQYIIFEIAVSFTQYTVIYEMMC